MKYKWGFELPDRPWVRNLSQEMQGPDIRIIIDEEDDQPPMFFWSSDHFNETDDRSIIAARAGSIKTIFDGALYLIHGCEFHAANLGQFCDLDEGHRLGALQLGATPCPFSPSVCTRNLSTLERHAVSNNLLWGSIFLTRNDLVVRGMLNLLGRLGVNFVSLFSLKDTMSTNGLPEQMQWEAANSSRAEWALFRHTANNFQASGPDARHGDLGHQPPPQPMPLNHASDLMLKATRIFIASRIAAANNVESL